MRSAALLLFAALAAAGCRHVPKGAAEIAPVSSYLQAVRSGATPASLAAGVADALLAGTNPRDLHASARDLAQQQHQLAAASPAADEALAREELAYALLERACATCRREQIPVLLQLTRLYAQRADSTGLTACAARAKALEPTGLSATRLQDWSLLRQQGELLERVGDFAGAARIERGLLGAKLQILAADHPQVAASRARIAELEAREQQLPAVGAPPPDPAR